MIYVDICRDFYVSLELPDNRQPRRTNSQIAVSKALITPRRDNMQLHLTLSGDNIRLPLASAHTMQGFIYNALKGDSEYQHNLHENGTVIGERRFKLFTFGELRGAYTIEEKDIIYRDKVILEIRSVDPRMLRLLYDYFTNTSPLRLGDNFVVAESVRLEDNVILTDEITVKTISPVTVYTTVDKHTIYFTPKEECFYEAVISNARRKWFGHFATDDGFELEIFPTENARFVKRATTFKHTFITAWHGTFSLKGNLKTLNFLYHTGLGAKNSQGFGMFGIKE